MVVQINVLFIRLKRSCVLPLGLYLALCNRKSENNRGFIKIDLYFSLTSKKPGDRQAWYGCLMVFREQGST